jgi:hypothetical protein
VCCFSIRDGVARAKPDNTGEGSTKLTREELEQAPTRNLTTAPRSDLGLRLGRSTSPEPRPGYRAARPTVPTGRSLAPPTAESEPSFSRTANALMVCEPAVSV